MPMEKHINILLPDQAINSLEFQHSFLIDKAGYYHRPNHETERTDLNEAILMLCLGGCGYVDYKGKNYQIRQGDIVILEPHVPHRYGAKKDDPWTIIWVHFHGDGIPGLMTLFKKFGINNIFHLENYQSIAEELNNILLLLTDHYNSLDIHKACSILQMVLLRMIETYAHKSSDDNRYMQEAIRFMKENVYNNIDLQTISQHLGISTYHTIRIFKTSLMTTPMQYYNMMRINEAGRLLLSSDLTVIEISRKMNYSSQFHFSQQFKNKMGVSPITYKKLMNYKY